uniref:Uncharacterized protein n=1 Tax=Podarcis muralis TaxID=64176 RepID=A0A670HNQ8_PODMU
MPGTPVFHCLPWFGQTHAGSFENTVQPSRPLLPVPSIFPNIRVFSRESSLLMRWPKYWSLSFRLCPSSEHSGLISFRMDRFDLLAVHGTLKSLLQHHNSNASILRQSAFFMVQLSLPYITTGETIAFTIRTFVGKVMSLLFKMLSKMLRILTGEQQAYSLTPAQFPSESARTELQEAHSWASTPFLFAPARRWERPARVSPRRLQEAPPGALACSYLPACRCQTGRRLWNLASGPGVRLCARGPTRAQVIGASAPAPRGPAASEGGAGGEGGRHLLGWRCRDLHPAAPPGREEAAAAAAAAETAPGLGRSEC